MSLLTNPELARHLTELLDGELGADTWKNYARTWKEFLAFKEEKNLDVSGKSACLWLVSVFMNVRRKTSVSGILNYARQISAILSRTDMVDDGYLKTFMRVMRKMGGCIPEQPAIPILKEEVYRVLSMRRFSDEEKMIIYIGWKIAARAADLRSIAVKDCQWTTTPQGEEALAMFWIPSSRQGVGSGRSKAANGMIRSCVAVFGDQTARVRQFLRGRVAITQLETQKISKLLQSIRPELTAHSLKRGALQYVLENEQEIPLEVITRLARHRNPNQDLPNHTMGYLSRVPLAMRLNTHLATRKL
eukprot:PhF_6_TR2265/c1_g4_i1/m.3897